MDKKFKHLVMAGVFVVWASFMAVTMLRSNDPPAWLWMVPSTTYTVLNGQIPGIRRDVESTSTGEPATTERA